MITPLDVYVAFRRASGKPYRLPKDWIAHMEKMPRQNREALKTVTDFFNTKWNKIDLDKFMRIGFELFPKFTYVKFFDSRVINMYITKDKNEKRDMDINKQKLVDSAKFIKKYIQQNSLINLKNYARKRDGFESIAVKHYNAGKVNAIFLYYLIHKRYLLLEEDDKALLGYIVENMRTLKAKMLNVLSFIEKCEEAINDYTERQVNVDGCNVSIKSSIRYTDI